MGRALAGGADGRKLAAAAAAANATTGPSAAIANGMFASDPQFPWIAML